MPRGHVDGPGFDPPRKCASPPSRTSTARPSCCTTSTRTRRDPKQWKGFKFAIPFEYSIHNFLLRYYLAEHGINPDTDVQLRVTPPARNGGPTCEPATSTAFLAARHPSTSVPFMMKSASSTSSRKKSGTATPAARVRCIGRLHQAEPRIPSPRSTRSVLTAAAMARDPKNRPLIAKVISPAAYLNQPETVVEQVLTGQVRRWSLASVKNVPDRADFDPGAMAIDGGLECSHKCSAGAMSSRVTSITRKSPSQVFLLTDAKKRMKELDQKVPEGAYKKFKVMGKGVRPRKGQGVPPPASPSGRPPDDHRRQPLRARRLRCRRCFSP